MKGTHMNNEEDDALDFEFELLNSDDDKIVTLVCSVSRPVSPDEYAELLNAFADHIRNLVSMAEDSLEVNSMN